VSTREPVLAEPAVELATAPVPGPLVARVEDASRRAGDARWQRQRSRAAIRYLRGRASGRTGER